MCQALDDEIQSIRKSGSGRTVSVTGGQFVQQEGEQWIYRFLLRGDHHFRDESPITLRLADDRVTGNVVTFTNGVLSVALDRDLGPAIAEAALLTDDSFLVVRLRDRLREAAAGKLPFQFGSANFLLTGSGARIEDAEPNERVFADGGLSEEQRGAVRRAFGSQLCYLWGPPGTGKTTTIGRLVEAHLRAGHSVLLVANTNVAVDTALERVCRQLEGEESFQQGQVLRWGPIVKDQLRARYGDRVELEKVCERVSASLRQELADLQRSLQEHRVRQAELKSWLDEAIAIEVLAEGCRTRVAAITKAESRLQKLVERVDAIDQGIATARANLARAAGMGTVRRWFSGLHPAAIQRSIDKAQVERTTAQSAVVEGQAALERDRSKLLEEQARVAELRGRVLGRPTLEEMRRIQNEFEATMRPKDARVVELQKLIKDVRETVLQNCKLLATTVYRTFVGVAIPRSFDVVVIDEASMLMLPLSYFVAGRATRSVVVAGDFRQLPPIVKADTDRARQWLKRDVFAAAGVSAALGRRERHPAVVALSEQYRMRPEICEVINALFYADRPLVTAPVRRVTEPESPALFAEKAPIYFVDTSKEGAWATYPEGKSSRYNLLHALLVRNLVVEFARSDYLPKDPGANTRVGVVAPYAAQTNLVERLLETALGNQGVGIASTVHRFQGNERSVVVFDLTDAVGVKLGKFLRATSTEEDGGRLINVALSRARDHIVVVGHFDYLRQAAGPRTIVGRLLEMVKKSGCELPVDKLLPLGDADWVDGLRAMGQMTDVLALGAAGVFNEKAFYGAFRQDLARAQKSIVVFSPFVTMPGTRRWVDLFQAAMGRGVVIRLVCKPPEEYAEEATEETKRVLGRLVQLGLRVDLRKGMHEKIAMIDEEILWHGSLNVFSHRATTESMLRLVNRQFCADMARMVTGLGEAEAVAAMSEAENPPCEECGGATVRVGAKNGPQFECAGGCGGAAGGGAASRRPASSGVPRGGRPEQESLEAGSACPSEECSGELVERNGRHGPFLGCSEYPDCRFTRNLRG